MAFESKHQQHYEQFKIKHNRRRARRWVRYFLTVVQHATRDCPLTPENRRLLLSRMHGRKTMRALLRSE